MAEAVGVRAEREGAVALYASPLLRARQTAEPIARRTGLSLRLEPGFREISYGEWEARPASEIRNVDGARYVVEIEFPYREAA